MARAKTTEGQALWQPGGAKEDSRFREGNRHLRLAYEEEEDASTNYQFTHLPIPPIRTLTSFFITDVAFSSFLVCLFFFSLFSRLFVLFCQVFRWFVCLVRGL